jgi:hypothetical protein
MFDESQGDFFDFRFGPLRMGALLRPFRASCLRTGDFHILTLRLSPELKKSNVKVRLQKDGILEIAWPRKAEREQIPIE